MIKPTPSLLNIYYAHRLLAHTTNRHMPTIMSAKSATYLLCLFLTTMAYSQRTATFVVTDKGTNTVTLAHNGTVAPLVVDDSEFPGVKIAAANLQTDLEQVTHIKPIISKTVVSKGLIVLIGTLGKSPLMDQLAKDNADIRNELTGKREKFIIQTIDNPMPNVEQALVIAGSDMRGTIYGIYELSEQIGVSPWTYWADVPVAQKANLFIKKGTYTAGEPAVRYRGIFLNDEAPALSGWSKQTFGGFNHLFYEKVFELILRLRGNFIWPAMWGSAFFDDDTANGQLATDMGVVVGTSHHEPLGRAHNEWRRYGSGKWDYSKNADVLSKFWQGGMARMKNYETLVTIGMRGDGDEPMSEESNIALLEKIVKDQRKIIADATGKKASETPQVWALYKEVQDYYDKGMRVPDDVTLLLCDDNWGNVRKLPQPTAKPHKGGYGMYYHFDYVGGPRNYKWLNVSQVQRTWEQMNLTYSHGVDRIWIVNVGDLKPMEYPISFFMDMAWNPLQFTPNNLLQHTQTWCAQQFGDAYAAESARLINLYTKYNRRVTPELLNDTTYSLENYREFETVVTDYRNLLVDAMRLYNLVPNHTKDAFDQLVLFPINGCCNLYELYYAVAMNHKLAKENNTEANRWADEAERCFARDSMLTFHYNQQIANGKWAHMMDQVRIGYTTWQQPNKSIMPKVVRVEVPTIDNANLAFVEKDGYVSIEAEHYARSHGSPQINWQTIPYLGKTMSGITTFPQNGYPSATDSVYVEYNVILSSTGTLRIDLLASPTLNFNANKGLRYAISINGGPEQVVNINQKYTQWEMERWQAQSINRTRTQHTIAKPGLQTLRVRVLEPGIVIQKIVIDTGGLKPNYLGPPESVRETK